VRGPRACLKCLRRSFLLDRLGPYIEDHSAGQPTLQLLELLRLEDAELATTTAPLAAPEILDQVAELSEAELYTRIVKAKCWACCRHDPHFPIGLHDAVGPHFALIGRGDFRHLKQLVPHRTVTVVGPSKASAYERDISVALGKELANVGIVVASGLRFGISACIHRGAIEGGLATAVLGSGANACTGSLRSLSQRIAEVGLVFSELWPSGRAWRWTAAASNRVSVALAGTTVVVDGTKQSDSFDISQATGGRLRSVGVVLDPSGPHISTYAEDLLAKGAGVVSNAGDVLSLRKESVEVV
jgi:predicted Rossmann fold nucleotide-binding protein DprA/Smf involved in DNA uptake